MAINVDLLKDKLSKRGITVKGLCVHLGIDESTYYRKLSDGGNSFTIEQIQKIVDFAKLSNSDARLIFLQANSHKCEK